MGTFRRASIIVDINNVGSIAQALSAKGNPDFDKIEAGKLQAAQVSLISLANCGSRIIIGQANYKNTLVRMIHSRPLLCL